MTAKASKLVQDVLSAIADPAPDYDDVTNKVLALIPNEERDAYLYEFIKLNVSNQISGHRVASFSKLKSFKLPKVGKAEPEPSTFIDIAPETPPKLVRKGPSKRDLILSAAEAVLTSRVKVPEVGLVYVGDLTVEYALAVAKDREERAGNMEASARMYRSFADAMREEGVTTLGEIPEKFASVVNPTLI